MVAFLHNYKEPYTILTCSCYHPIILQGRSLKAALKKVVKGHLQLSEKMTLVFEAMDKVVDEMQDVPEHLKTKRLDEGM